MQYWLLALTIIACLVLAQGQEYLPGLLAADVPELSGFFELLNTSNTLYTRVKWGGVTILAPTNDALAAANLRQPNMTTQQRLDALLQYHVLDGIHPGVSLGRDSSSYQTLLDQSPMYTNRTGGQVVEVVRNDTAVSFVTGALANSTIVKADVLFQIGVLHCIDAVLDIPLQVAQAVIAANLSDFLSLAEKGKLSSDAFNPFLADVQDSSDTTIFAPNAPAYGYNFTGWDTYTTAQDLAIWKYHWINGTVLQSANATNGSTFTTAAGLNITTWLVGDDLYINDAKVIQRDLLQANGVIQVLDRPLDPNNTNARPDFNMQDSSVVGTSLTVATKVGIAVGSSAALFVVILAVICCLRRRQRMAQLLGIASPIHPRSPIEYEDEKLELGGRSMYELANTAQIAELSPTKTFIEMPTRRYRHVRETYTGKVYELDVVEQTDEYDSTNVF